jgi:hypothetical protein
MINNLANIKIGLALVMLGLLFGIGLGVTFGVNEAFLKRMLLKESLHTRNFMMRTALERYGAMPNERISTPQE